MRICAPVLLAYELVLRPKLQKLQSALVRIKNQAHALRCATFFITGLFL